MRLPIMIIRDVKTKVIILMSGAKRTFKIIQKVPEPHTGKARNKELQKTATFGAEY